MTDAWQQAGWPAVRLADVADLLSGGTPSRKRPEFFSGEIPWLTSQDIPEGRVTDVEKGRECVGPEAIRNSATRLVPAGTVLMTTRVSVGKTAVAARPLCYSQDVTGISIRLSEILDPHFLACYLLSQHRKFLQRNQGSTISGITRDNLALESVPLPGLGEQKRIVLAFREMQVIGELTANARTAIRMMFSALFFDRFSRKGHRSFSSLADIADVVSGVALGRQIRGGGVREISYIRVANVQAGYLDLSEVKETKASEAEIEAYALRAGDILLTEGGDFDKLGRGCLWSGEVEPCIHQNHVFRVRPDPKRLNSHFFTQYLQSAEAKQYFLRCAKRTTNLASINLTQLKKLPVPDVSLADQERFAQEVDEVLKCIEIDGSDVSDRLVASLQSYAFSGQLTAAWRVRHASLLAEEIRDRDAALRSAGVVPVGDSSRDARDSPIVPVATRIDGLTRDQLQVLERINGDTLSARDDSSETARGGATLTAAEIASTLTGALHDNIHAVEANLCVLVARGLVVALCRAQLTPDTGERVYGDCYRLAVHALAEDQENDGESPIGGTEVRDREILRILGQAPAGESEP